MTLSVFPKNIVSQSLIQKDTKHKKKLEFWSWKIDNLKDERLTKILEEFTRQTL